MNMNQHLIDKVEKVEVDTIQVEPYLPKIYEKLEWMDRNDLIQRFVSIEFNRFSNIDSKFFSS